MQMMAVQQHDQRSLISCERKSLNSTLSNNDGEQRYETDEGSQSGRRSPSESERARILARVETLKERDVSSDREENVVASASRNDRRENLDCTVPEDLDQNVSLENENRNVYQYSSENTRPNSQMFSDRKHRTERVFSIQKAHQFLKNFAQGNFTN